MRRMEEKRICDRCHKDYTSDRYESHAVAICNIHYVNGVETIGAQYDFCPECAAKIYPAVYELIKEV